MGASTMRGRVIILGIAALVVASLTLAVLVSGGQDEEQAAPQLTSTTMPTTSTTMPTTSSSVSTTAPSTSTTSTPVASSTTATSQLTSSSTPPLTNPATVVRHGNQADQVVALTFDAGSDAGFATEILDTLSADGVPATFGMTGRWAEENPAVVRRIVAEGHQLVNHSYDHPSFTGLSTGAGALSREERTDQLERADAAVRAAAGVTMAPWFRPPYGDEDASVRADVALAGYRYELLWTVDSLGWQGLPADAVTRRCLERAEPGAIYLFHVGSASADHAALQAIIDGLRARGYRFATAAGVVAA